MGEKRIETGVDDLIRLLKDNQKHFIEDVSKELNISLDVLKLWIDFLVEEKIISIEYSFTKPFIFLSENKNLSNVQNITFNTFKQNFIEQAKKNKLPETKFDFFWQKKLMEELEKSKEFFYTQAKNRKLIDLDTLWQTYIKKVLNETK
ncbi:MAG: hypothetical protein AB7V77_05805 [Candidatus Woesearchaeota archaeon]